MALTMQVRVTGKGRVDSGGIWSGSALHVRRKDEAAASPKEGTV